MTLFIVLGVTTPLGSKIPLPQYLHWTIAQKCWRHTNKFVLHYVMAQAWARIKLMAVVSDGTDAPSKLCHNRNFFQSSLEYSWTKNKPLLVDEITCLDLFVIHNLRKCIKWMHNAQWWDILSLWSHSNWFHHISCWKYKRKIVRQHSVFSFASVWI
jgi:hypothetical protein